MKQTAIYLSAFGLSASLPTSVVRLATSRPHEVLSELFVPRHIKSDEKTFLKIYSLVCVSVRVWSWKNAKSRWQKKKRKEREQEKKKERKKERKRKSTQTQLLGFELALLRQLFASHAWNFTTQPQENKIHSIAEYHVTITRPTVWKRNTSHAVSEANKNKKVKLIVQISFAEKIKFKEEGSVTFRNFFLQWPTFVMWYRCCHAARL